MSGPEGSTGNPTLASPLEARDVPLLEALRRGEEAAFVTLLERYHQPLLRLATFFVKNWAVAEEVVQETWLGVFQGIDRFEARSSLKTWIFRILANRAKSRARREGRTPSLSSLATSEIEAAEAAVEPGRFQGAHEELPNHWASPPKSWGENPEKRLLAQETRAQIQTAISTLPEAQQVVITLRDVNQLTPEEVCNILEISETNQRVLLHRARSRVRRVLEEHLTKE
ncbi:MAG: RNA polymerase sigma factor [Candidatus Methylomirabilales bacterium]